VATVGGWGQSDFMKWLSKIQDWHDLTSRHLLRRKKTQRLVPGNTKGGSITVPLTSCLTGVHLSALQIKTTIVSCYTADSKPVKQEVKCTVILPPLVFPACAIQYLTLVILFVEKKNQWL
jgi:hypothetical protein